MSDTSQHKSADDTHGVEPSEATDDTPPLTLLEMFGSAISAMIGVQSREKRERDFARGKASHFIIVGVVITQSIYLLDVILFTFIIAYEIQI